MKKRYICLCNCDNTSSTKEIVEDLVKKGYHKDYWVPIKVQFIKDNIYTYHYSNRYSNVIYLDNEYHGYVTHNFIEEYFTEYDEVLMKIDQLFDEYLNKENGL